MSEHHHRQGPYTGQPSQILPHPPFAQSPSPFNTHSPYYGSFQQPPAATSNFATVNNSFQYNASNIPGLGMGGPLPPVPYRTESNVSFHQQPQSQIQHISTHTPEKASTTVPKQRDLENPPNKQGSTAFQSHVEPTLEEGELSEGEFDDLYEPQHTIDTAVPVHPSRPLSVADNENGSVGDADGSSIYDGVTPQDDTVINSTSTSLPAAEQDYSPDEDWEPSYQERERSGSYSPYLSPREIQRKMSVTKPPVHLTKQSTETAHMVQSLPGINMPSAQPLPANAPLLNGTSSALAEDPANTFRSIAEAKKKAQEAILGLWPLKVRYQDYIDEGFDEKLIKSLFMELGLEASIPKPIATAKSAGASDLQASTASRPDSSKAASEPLNTKEKPSVGSESSKPVVAESTSKTGTMDDAKAAGKTAAEERKDKIARKLAAKAQKTVVVPQTSAPTPPSQSMPTAASIPASSTLSPAKPKTRAENNAILHQKLAALKKAQEKAIAEKKLATESLSKPATPPTGLANNSTAIPEVKTREEPSTNPTAIVGPPELTRRSVSTEKSLPRDGAIPGLFVATQSTQPTNRSLKRPVASDFDSYSNPIGTLKRTRTQETLIIDVSDDEDVEMDIASPTDEPTSPNEITNPTRQTPLGAFPPLSDSLNRKQRSSPGSSTMPTPPVHGAKLDLLHRRIEETKRLIAEAEAKKAAKKITTPQSPQTQHSATESSPLPKPNGQSQAQKEARSLNIERRLRIRSYELPAVGASLKETQDQLRQTMAQTAQLELQILEAKKEELRLAAEERRLAEEERRLAEEAAELEDSAEETPTEENPQGQLPLAVAAADVLESNHAIRTQISNERLNSNEATDVLMTDREDTPNHEEIRAGALGETQSDLRADGQPITVTRLSQDPALDDEPQPEADIDDQSSQGVSFSVPTENDDAEPNSTGDISEILNENSENGVQATPIEESTRDQSPISNDSYKPSSPPTAHAHVVPLPGLGNSTDITPSTQNNVSLDIQSTREVINETGPTQSVQEPTFSAPDNQGGEVQNSSSLKHLLLTSRQDEPEQGPRLEDLLSYHSPLGYFRAYRFHPKYFDEVAGGLKSLTYSSRIDPMRPLCPRVLAGEPCPDGLSCDFQHFESMVLPDAEIITQLGSADMFTGDTRNKFIEGLKKVLNELKANKVKDFDRITKAIVKHRQEFLEDKSKVLPLDASTS
ncbi:hypothetical protein F5Y04DRAFT_248485 [Hypomontagnella monticulosa]|nr:hypothetical protein F5Y04DRAFT_248485 [Hypomontagnella monticulosa]